MTITGSEAFIGNAVFDPANIALVIKVKEQIETNIFRHENDAVLNLQYVESINPTQAPVVSNYSTGYSMWDTNAAAFDAITRAASRVVSFFKDIGVDITSELVTPVKFKDIFMSAYVFSMQIILLYNDKMAVEKANMKPPVTDQPNPDNSSAMSDTNIESEHKSIFDGINPNDNGESVIDFPKESDEFSDLLDKMSNFQIEPHYPWEKDDNE
jgi:hypothetical protein